MFNNRLPETLKGPTHFNLVQGISNSLKFKKYLSRTHYLSHPVLGNK